MQNGTEWLFIVAFLACMWYPMRQWCAGGAVAPSLLKLDLTGKVAIVTGGNTGIGYETALQLAKQHATVVIASRDATRVGNAVASIKAAVPGAAVEGMLLDLGNFASVKAFAANFKATHASLAYLVNNAGVMTPPASNCSEGWELQFCTNHLGHFLLTEELLPVLTASAPSRIINVASLAHMSGSIDLEDPNGWSKPYLFGIQQYAESKLANILHARELAARLRGTGVTAYSLHPGAVRTELARHFTGGDMVQWATATFWKSPWEGAQTTLHAILDPTLPETANGEYFADCAVQGSVNPQFRDMDVARKLDAFSRRAVGLAA